MRISISLENNLSCELICNRVQKAINDYMKEFNDAKDALIVIDIVKTTEDTSFIPKIEHKQIVP